MCQGFVPNHALFVGTVISQSMLLALDQVLRKHWSCLTIFGTSRGSSKMEHPGGVEIAGSHSFVGLWTQQRVLGFM
jgi:hypothetical protein